MQKRIYIDYASTTPIDPRVKKVVSQCLDVVGNPASRAHRFGHEAEQIVEDARAKVATLINAESDNLAIKGIANSTKRGHIITSAIEHNAVLDTCRHLENQGFAVTYISPTADGIITTEAIKDALRDDTILVSLMHVNNELGTITDITSIGELIREHNAVFHIDAAQSAARLPIDVQKMPVDLISLSAHKMYGPKGIGALYIKRQIRTKIEPQIHGGGHEGGLRSGTLPTHQIAGMGEAAQIISSRMATEQAHLSNLTDCLLHKFSTLDGVTINGQRDQCVPGIVNASFANVNSESMILALDDVAISTGSACTSAEVKPSHVLMGIGLSAEEAYSSLRFSFGRFTTELEIDYIGRRIEDALIDLRAIAEQKVVSHAI